MIDLQNQNDDRIGINKVGINSLFLPIMISNKKDNTQNIVAKIMLAVNLPKEIRGTHMSRFIELLNKLERKKFSMNDCLPILKIIKSKLNAQSAYFEMEFKYFLDKTAPISHKKSLLDYDCKFICSLNDKFEKTLVVKVPITTLCPCSKAISKYGAHNQRNHVSVSITTDDFIWIEDIVSLVEKEASCEIYSLLKREDEKYVSEKAYDNPYFVEDIVRNISLKLKEDRKIKSFSVFSESFESIHNHNTFAFIERDNIP